MILLKLLEHQIDEQVITTKINWFSFGIKHTDGYGIDLRYTDFLELGGSSLVVLLQSSGIQDAIFPCTDELRFYYIRLNVNG